MTIHCPYKRLRYNYNCQLMQAYYFLCTTKRLAYVSINRLEMNGQVLYSDSNSDLFKYLDPFRFCSAGDWK